MKPHPRLRKTIKWGGLVLTIILGALLIVDRLGFSIVLSNTVGLSFSVMADGPDVVIMFGDPVPMTGVCMPGECELSTYYTPSEEAEANGEVWPDWEISLFGVSFVKWWSLGYSYHDSWGMVFSIRAAFIVCGLLTGWFLWRDRTARNPGECARCRYDLTGLVSGSVCPECGTLSKT